MEKKKYNRKKKRYITVSFEIDDVSQNTVAEWLMKYQPKARGEAIVEMWKRLYANNDTPLTYLESRLLSIVEARMSGNMPVANSRVVNDEPEDTVDVERVLDDQLNIILGE